MPRNDAYRPLWTILFIVAGFLALGGLSWLRTGGKDLVPWRTDLPAARTESAASHKPLLLYFTAAWCGPCQQMRRTTWSNQKVADTLSSQSTPVRIDIDEHPKLAQEYHVESIPTLILFDQNGRVTKSTSGAMDADEFLTWLKG